MFSSLSFFFGLSRLDMLEREGFVLFSMFDMYVWAVVSLGFVGLALVTPSSKPCSS